MYERLPVEKIIVCHKSVSDFDCKIAIDWAIDMIRNGIESENILILASFSYKDSYSDIYPFIDAVINDLGLIEKTGKEADLQIIRYYLGEILNEIQVRNNLHSLCLICISTNHSYGLTDIYVLYYAYESIQDGEQNYYSEAQNLNELYVEIKQAAHKWLLEHI
jgi:hypothetical protein